MRTRRSQSSSDPVSSGSFFAKATKDTHRPLVTKETLAGHTPVLLHEAIDSLSLTPDDCVVDATLGGAGHAGLIAKKLGKKGVLIGFDLDIDAIARAKEALKGTRATTHLIAGNFRNLESELHKLEIPSITKALFDLGWSSYQLDSGRGFSFLHDEPLSMTYSKDSAKSAVIAATIVNEWEEESIADILFGWGEEHYSRRIAKAIVERRLHTPFTTSVELAEVIKAAVPPRYRYGRIHPATRTFQALRIAVNDELGALTEGLRSAWKYLAPGGRIAVITFHSIEDRLVKQMFAGWEKAGEGKRSTHKPIRATDAELSVNRRARSAKLRVIEKS